MLIEIPLEEQRVMTTFMESAHLCVEEMLLQGATKIEIEVLDSGSLNVLITAFRKNRHATKTKS